MEQPILHNIYRTLDLNLIIEEVVLIDIVYELIKVPKEEIQVLIEKEIRLGKIYEPRVGFISKVR